jgi:hypothetical protein
MRTNNLRIALISLQQDAEKVPLGLVYLATYLKRGRDRT